MIIKLTGFLKENLKKHKDYLKTFRNVIYEDRLESSSHEKSMSCRRTHFKVGQT